MISRIFFRQLSAFLYHFDIISVSGDCMHFTFEKLIKFLKAEVWSINFTTFFSDFCSVSFSRLKYTSLSKTCQLGAGTSMIRQFHDFLAGFLIFSPTVRRGGGGVARGLHSQTLATCWIAVLGWGHCFCCCRGCCRGCCSWGQCCCLVWRPSI